MTGTGAGPARPPEVEPELGDYLSRPRRGEGDTRRSGPLGTVVLAGEQRAWAPGSASAVAAALGAGSRHRAAPRLTGRAKLSEARRAPEGERLRERSRVRRSAGVAAGGAFPRRGGGGGDAAALLPLPRLRLPLRRPKPAPAPGRRGGGSPRPRRLPAARPDAASPPRAPVAGPGLPPDEPVRTGAALGSGLEAQRCAAKGAACPPSLLLAFAAAPDTHSPAAPGGETFFFGFRGGGGFRMPESGSGRDERNLHVELGRPPSSAAESRVLGHETPWGDRE